MLVNRGPSIRISHCAIGVRWLPGQVTYQATCDDAHLSSAWSRMSPWIPAPLSIVKPSPSPARRTCFCGRTRLNGQSPAWLFPATKHTTQERKPVRKRGRGEQRHQPTWRERQFHALSLVQQSIYWSGCITVHGGRYLGLQRLIALVWILTWHDAMRC